MTLDQAFKIILELAEDSIKDCAADRDMLSDYKPTLSEMQEALNLVKGFTL